jgi:hypothetical protein
MWNYFFTMNVAKSNFVKKWREGIAEMKIEVLPIVKESYLDLVRREAYWLTLIERLRLEGFSGTAEFFVEKYNSIKQMRLELKEKVEGRR